MKLNNYYTELPNDFKEIYVIDAKDKKTVKKFNIYSSLIAIIVFAITLYITSIFRTYEVKFELNQFIILYLIFFLVFFVYIVLHELTHGVMYYIFTRQKLTFGLTKSVAFCGVPHIYTNKKTALFSILAPFIVYTIVLIPFIIIVEEFLYSILIILLFALHIGGCIGDLYCAYMLICKIKVPCLVNDTGPKQTFYIEIKQPIE